jgi:hypothetical protein
VNKKKQKNFIRFFDPGCFSTAPSGAKVFWFLRPDDGAARPRSLNRAAQNGSKE